MSRFISALCATMLATTVVACDRSLPFEPETGTPLKPGIGISKSSIVCDSGCTSNYNGMGPGGDTVWIEMGQSAVVEPLSGVANMVIRSFNTVEAKSGIAAQAIDTTHVAISANSIACHSPVHSDTTCTYVLKYQAGPPTAKTPSTAETIVVVVFTPRTVPVDTVWIPMGQSAIVAPLAALPNLAINSVNSTGKGGLVASLVDATHIAITTPSGTCSSVARTQTSCTQLVTYVTGTATGTIVVELLTPPTFQNTVIPVGYTGPGTPLLIPASRFATDVYGTPLVVTAASTQTSFAGFGVSVVNGELAVTRALFVFGTDGLPVPVQVTVSDGKTWATSTITLQLQ